jgi:glycogen debranching enzyme
VYESFNRRFWNAPEQQLFDVVDGPSGDDASGRPNQIFSLSLPHAVLDPSRWTAVLARVEATLLTPVGLRTLPPGHAKYQSKYDGDLRVRDGAYHQGTVWPWLIGAFVDAWLRCHPGEREKARQLLVGFIPHLSEGAVGSISEIFDADPPFKHRGCVAQAWSVAELLRSWFNTAPV